MGNNDDDRDQLADEISRYLEAHPGAADSVEGIVRWWLARQRYEFATHKVQEALNYLESRGVVRKSVSSGGRVIYRSSEAGNRRSGNG